VTFGAGRFLFEDETSTSTEDVGVTEPQSIMFFSEFEQDLFEDAALRLGISLRELTKHARWINLDPVPVKGERVTFPETCLVDCVPVPTANIDLREAWTQMRVDDAACEFILTHTPSHEDVLRVIRNQLAWMRFLAARCETPEGRDVYRTMAAFREATLRALAARFRTKRGGETMIDALEEILEPRQ
jgi:hypothetical protein